MGETIAILFVFFVLILFGLIFYFQWQKTSFERQRVEVFADKSISISQVATYLPELACSPRANLATGRCIDVLKLELAEEEMQAENDYYFDIFGFATIRVEKIYPEPTGEKAEWVLYNQTPPEITRKVNTPLPMVLYEPSSGDRNFGVLYVDVYT